MNQKYTVAILGGGLSGLTLGIQLLQNNVKDIVVLDKLRYPLPEATVKVGKSTVEIGSYYYTEILGLEDHILQKCLDPNPETRADIEEASNLFELLASEYS